MLGTARLILLGLLLCTAGGERGAGVLHAAASAPPLLLSPHSFGAMLGPGAGSQHST